MMLVADPKYATPLNPDRPNLLKQCRDLAKLIGLFPLLPWQELVLALMTEYEEGNPEDGIVPFYNQVVISIPRQTGKSEVIITCAACLRFSGFYRSDGAPPLMMYAAQTQSDAIGVIESKVVHRLGTSDWGQEMGFVWSPSANDPHLRVGGKSARTGRGRFSEGKMRIVANKSGSGLGATSDAIFLDEARQYGDESREADLVPQMNTRPAPQLIVVSTMGGPFSPYFNRKVDVGRVLAEQQAAGQSRAVRRAYVEYGVGDVGSDDYDAGDPKIWQAAHPMLGYCNWTLERMEDEHDRCAADGNLEMFRNNYLNQRLRVDDDPAIPLDLITAAERPDMAEDELGDWRVLGLSSTPEGRYLAAAECGEFRVRLVRPGYDAERGDVALTEKHLVRPWLRDYLEARPYIRQVRYVADTEMSALLERFRHPGCRMTAVSLGDYRAACVGLLTGFATEKIGLFPSTAFREAILGAERYEGALGRNWMWRRKPDLDTLIDPLVAVTLSWGGWADKASRPGLKIH